MKNEAQAHWKSASVAIFMQYDVAFLLDVTDVLEAGKFEYGIVLLC